MKGTRKEWIDRAKGLPEVYGTNETWERLADLAEEHGGPFEPEPPPVEVVWEFPPDLRLMDDGSWWHLDRNGWHRSPEPASGSVYAELSRRLLAEWRARQGDGDAFDAAAREWHDPAAAWNEDHRHRLAAIFRRHAKGLPGDPELLEKIRSVGRAEGSMDERARIVAWLRTRYRDTEDRSYRYTADALERGEHLEVAAAGWSGGRR